MPPSRSAVLEWVAATNQRLLRRNTKSLQKSLVSSAFRFANPPDNLLPAETFISPNCLHLDLTWDGNALALSHETWLKDQEDLTSRYIAQYANDHDLATSLNLLLSSIRADLSSFDNLKRVEWKRQRKVVAEANSVDPGIYMVTPFASMEPWAITTYIIVLCLYLVTGISQVDCSLYLSMLSILTHCIMPTSQGRRAQLPKTIDTLIDRCKIRPRYKSYACCPNCFRLYDPEKPYPAYCDFAEFSGGDKCGAALQKADGQAVREFVVQDFKDWLARLIARPGIEDLLDRDALSQSTPGKMTDIWDGPVLRNFKGPGYAEGKNFMRNRGTDFRLIFSINMDGFNPYGNKQSGKQVSVGAIYMTCLNLPRGIRNRMENVFLVGVIPGPKEPSLSQINNVLKPVVDVLLELWDIGVYFQQTSRYPLGRRAFVAVIPLVSDLIASKKMAAFGSARSRNFCSHCHLTLDDIANLDFHSWEHRTQEEHRKHAGTWKTAVSKEEQDDIFNRHGLRWSELLRLPYWDPTSYVVIDSMHCFYLGLFHRHAIHIWGMDAGVDDGDGVTYSKLSTLPTGLEFHTALKAFSEGNFKNLSSMKWHILAHLCANFDLHFGGSKASLVSNLQKYRSSLPPGHMALNYPPQENSSAPEVQASVDEAVDLDKNSRMSPTEAASTKAPRDAPLVQTGDLGPLRAQNTVTEAAVALPSFDDNDIRFWWSCAPKSRWGSYHKAQLERVINVMKPSTHLPRGTTKAGLVQMIQNFRFEAGIIDAEGHVVDQKMRERSRKHNKSALGRDGSLIWAQLTNDSAEHEFQAITRLAQVENGEPKGKGGGVANKAKKQPKTCVLGRQTIPDLRRDMSRISLPSWVSKGPAYPGQAKGGKLHADQWRSFFNVNLPVSLIRLWGFAARDSRKGRMLENFLYLVSAVKVASQRTITEQDILIYEDHMHKYLTTLWQLYPGVEITPYQHIALHFGEFLRKFGPTHGWRCFSFERYNFILQQTLTNQLFGQMEKTMFQKFTMVQNLQALINVHRLPDQLHPLVEAYSRSFHDVRGTLLSEDIGSSTEHEANIGKKIILQKDILSLLEDWVKVYDSARTIIKLDGNATFRESIREDVIYRTVACSAPDSQIVFQNDPISHSGWAVGSITQIFEHERSTLEDGRVREVFLLVSPYETVDLNAAGGIPWPMQLSEQVSFVPGRLYRRRSLPGRLVRVDQVLGHFGMATTDYVDGTGIEIFQAIPLLK